MKRLITELRWKRHLRRSSRRESAKLERRVRSDLFQHLRELKNLRPVLEMKFPPTFSLIEAPSETIAFCNQIRQNAMQNHLRFDLGGLTKLTVDGIAVFIATLNERLIRQTTNVYGNEPQQPELKEILDESGFYGIVKRRTPTVSKENGKIMSLARGRGHESKRFRKEVAAELIDYATSLGAFPPLRFKRTYHAVEEMMENTVQHASIEGTAKEPWWTSVFYDKHRHVARFTFNDNGVGIFKSLRFKQILKLYGGAPFSGAGDKLKRILNGDIRSRTNLPWRGEGLPAIRKDCERGFLERLIVITNDAYADVSAEIYVQLSVELKGTFYYWEVPVGN